MPLDWRGWVPHQLRFRGGQAECQWLYLGTVPFDAPFFEETAASCQGLPQNSLREPRLSGLEDLVTVAETVEAVSPAAFIFHISRCGSTILSQLLGEMPGVVTLSEVPFFDDLLRAPRTIDAGHALDAGLIAAIRLYGQKRIGQERASMVKLDSWHICFFDRLRRLYPTTPVILLYREPAAVIASHRRMPGRQAVPGLIDDAVFGFAGSEQSSYFDHLPRVLAKFYDEILRVAQSDARSLLLPYQNNMLPATQTVLDFIGWDVSPERTGALERRNRFHGKRASEAFLPLAVTETSLSPAERLCAERYAALEAFRSRISSSST